MRRASGARASERGANVARVAPEHSAQAAPEGMELGLRTAWAALHRLGGLCMVHRPDGSRVAARHAFRSTPWLCEHRAARGPSALACRTDTRLPGSGRVFSRWAGGIARIATSRAAMRSRRLGGSHALRKRAGTKLGRAAVRSCRPSAKFGRDQLKRGRAFEEFGQTRWEHGISPSGRRIWTDFDRSGRFRPIRQATL